MKRTRVTWFRGAATAAALLCLVALQTSATEVAKKHLVWVSNASWSSDLSIDAGAAGGTLRKTDCAAGAAGDTISLAGGTSAWIENFAGNLCSASGGAAGLAALDATGDLDIWTFARYRDSFGVNWVAIPALTAALPAGDTGSSALEFTHVRNDAAVSTTVAFFTVSAGSVTITVTSDETPWGEREVVALQPFTFYELHTRFHSGTLRVTAGTHGFGCGGCSGAAADIYAVAFVGRREGGSPIPLQPRLIASF